MYKAIFPSIIYAESVNIGLAFDVASFADLVESNVKAINRAIDAFENVPGTMDSYALMNEISIHVEIIEKGVFLSVQEKDIVFKDETKKAVKKLFVRVCSLIHKLGEYDMDFRSMSMTRRATPSNEVMEYLEKKW